MTIIPPPAPAAQGGSARLLARCRRASAAVELALVMPIAMLICAGIVEFGSLFEVYTATNELASQYALSWANCSDSPAGTCNTELTQYTSANSISNLVPQLTGTLTLQMFEVTMNGTSPTVVYAYPSGGTLSAAQTTVAQSTFTSGQTGVIVTATYTHTLRFFSTLMTPFLGSYLTPSYTVAQIKD